MNYFKKWIVGVVILLSSVVGPGIATASPTDSSWTWSYGGLRVATIGQGGDGHSGVRFRNPDGTIRSFWPNSAGVDICGRTDLILARAREDFKEIVETLNLAGLNGKTVWVAYEPTAGVCYIKAVEVAM